MKNIKPPKEWLKQAEYDLDTAEAMFNTGRYIYTVFMCHLSIEKALKGIFSKKFKEDPPRIHNLNYFCNITGLIIPDKFQDFIDKLNTLS
ncbi:MAG: HEPN domain-containing protein, partial [Spirochaetota bacterium]